MNVCVYGKRMFLAVLVFACHTILGQKLVVKHFTSEDGLPHDVLYSVTQDASGYLWIGTDNGLARFDGASFAVFSGKNGLTNNFVTDLQELNDRTKVIATWGGGLHLMVGDTVYPFKHPEIPSKIRTLQVKGDQLIANQHFDASFCEVAEGPHMDCSLGGLFSSLDGKKVNYFRSNQVNNARKKPQKWIQITGNRYLINHLHEILLFNGRLGLYRLTENTMEPLFPKVLKNERISAVFEDCDHNLWLGGRGKIYKISATNDIEVLTCDLPMELIWKIRAWVNEQLVFVTRPKGDEKGNVYALDILECKIKNLLEPAAIRSTISDMEVDKDHVLWLATDGNGLYQIRQNRFEHINEAHGLNNTFVQTMAEDAAGTMWLGTKGGVYSIKTGEKKAVFLPLPTTSTKTEVRHLSFDNSGKLSISRHDHIFTYDGQSLDSLPGAGYDLLFEGEEMYELGTHGLNVFRTGTNGEMGASELYIKFPDSLRIRQVIRDASGEGFWLPSWQGVLHLENGVFNDTLTSQGGLVSDRVNHLTYDQSGTLWIATEAGLCKSESGVVTCYTSSDGLVSNQCRSLLVDDSGYVWVGTPKGTSRFDGQSFISFNTSNGLLSNDVNALFQDSKKRLWIGGSKGISVLNLYPELKLKKAPVLELTKFALNGKTGRFHPYSTFQHASSLTFGFSALKSLGSKDAVMIQYQLNDGPWRDTDRRSFEFYSLSQGDYKLTLRAKGMETAWSTPMTLAFDIAPPGWLSLPAFIAYLAAVMLLMLGVMKYEKRKLMLKAELRKKSLEATQLKELDTLKSRFFSNISHEFRTPLALIIGPLEQLFESDLKATHQKKLHMVHRNATGLLELINQLLDLSRMEADQLKRNIETRELVADIREFAESFLMLADSTNKHFEVNYEISHLEMRYDYHEIRKIIYNLLYNAFKFTPPDSVIRLSVAVDPVGATGKGSVLLVVEDTGMGIQKENIDKIFTPFFQEEHAPADHLGSGLGLALVKELVALNEGSIEVSSQMGQGTTFVVQLPIKVEEKGQVANGSNVPIFEEEATWDDQDIQEKRSVILLVEDHRDMRQFICEVLAGSYQLITARDATEGLEQAQERIPDLIISDVMMPGTDGFQFCKQLKTTESTSHIPVVLLTAKAGMVNKLEGLETGADDYLTKPFSQKELRVRVSNLIRQRQVLRKKFSSDPDMSLSDVALNSVDEQFLHRVVGVINEHLTNFDFDIELLARETGLSRGHLHKKIKALTGLTPSEFNRKVRLKHAASLLKKPVGNVSEICYRVGFNSHSYFSKCFLQQYGQTPSDFMAQHGAGVSMA